MTTEQHEESSVIPTPNPKSKPFACHAVIAHKETGEVQVVHARNKNDLAKTLSRFDKYAVLGVFRGKQLNIEQKSVFSFT